MMMSEELIIQRSGSSNNNTEEDTDDPELKREHKRKRTHTDVDQNNVDRRDVDVSPSSGKHPRDEDTTDCIDMFEAALPTRSSPHLLLRSRTGSSEMMMDIIDSENSSSSNNIIMNNETKEPDKKSEEEDPKCLIVSFLKQHTVYSVMPISSKVLVLDVEVPLRLAFFALVENSASSAPIWDSMKGMVGLLSPSEFLTVLLYFYPSRTISKNLLSHSLKSWLLQRGEAVKSLRKQYQDRELMPPPQPQSSKTFPPVSPSSNLQQKNKRSPTVQIPSRSSFSSQMSSSCPSAMSISMTPPQSS